MTMVKQWIKSYTTKSKEIFYFIFLIVVFASCKEENKLNLLELNSKNLADLIRTKCNNADTILLLSEGITTQYDSVYIYSEYTLLNDIEKYTKLALRNSNNINELVEGENDLMQVKSGNNLLIVKTSNNLEVYFLNMPRSEGDFSRIKQHAYSMETSKFKISCDSTENWIYIADMQ